eukprot:TRINITY_DN24055_c0_g1_i1.p1 TRINITY_DN24055_c0_g1~~TRINITY_DN24055_c0_g1_i1.p1  ORF type:complete len:373 (-),score=49.37 TRINITY_DN24055_c0_g1_i1:59-1177(-)
MTRQELDAHDWMAWFIGTSERALINQKERYIDDNRNFKGAGDKLWPAGIFECPPVADLRREIDQMPARRPPGQACPLRAIDGTDIGSYQAAFTTEQRAMVQIASNFHCLENGNPRTPADCGYLVSNYATDSTQGPAAAFGVPAASLLRAHYAFKSSGNGPDAWGQTEKRQVNLIEDICGDYCGDCVNGKARLLGTEKPVTPDLVDDVAGKVKVGLHSDAQVVFARGSSRGRIAVIDEPQLVDQVCSATLCYGFANAIYDPPQQQLENLTRALLRAAYEGAYLAAIKRKRKILLLTLIGGACFRNPLELIIGELKRAHAKYSSHPSSELEEVQLVLYEKGVAGKYQAAVDATGDGSTSVDGYGDARAGKCSVT